MYIFFFWPFRVIGFILTLYALAAIAEKFFPNLILGEAGAIIAMFGVILSLLFWINFVDLYFKLMDPDVPKKTRGRKKKKAKSTTFISNFIEVLKELLRGVIGILNFVIGLINPLVWIIIIISILASLAI